jgi:hypothetical protein
MFKFEDTDIIDQISLDSGAYVLAYSEDCEERYGTGYTVRHYPGEEHVEPWCDQCETNIDFSDLAGGLAQLDAFDEDEEAELKDWLTEVVGIERVALTPEEEAERLAIIKERARELCARFQAKGVNCSLINNDTAVEVEFSSGHFMTYETKLNRFKVKRETPR